MRRPFFIAYSALFVCGLVAAEPQKGFYRYPAPSCSPPKGTSGVSEPPAASLDV